MNKNIKLDTVTCNGGYMGESFVLSNDYVYPFRATVEASRKVNEFRIAHPEIDIDHILDKAIVAELEKEETRLNASLKR